MGWKRMKKKRIISCICVVLASLMIVSCGSRKSTYTSSIDEEVLKRIDTFIKEQKESFLVWSDNSELFENVNIIEREFDTTQAPDSLGNYPIKKEIVTEKESNKKNNIEGNIQESEDKETSIVDNTENSKHQDTNIIDEKHESKTPTYLFWGGVMIFILLILFFLKRLGLFKSK